MKEFLINYYTPITQIVEILAVLAGLIYVYKSRDNISRLFVYYLLLTVFVESFALYARFMQNNYDNELFILIKNSPFCSNYWIYNIRTLLAMVILGKYFSLLVSNLYHKRLIKYLVIGYLAFTIAQFIFTDVFLYGGLQYNAILETLIFTVFVSLYYLEILNSDKILTFYKSKHFYIGTAFLLWSLAITPLFIFQDYYSYENPNFLYLRQFILLCANIIMYLCFTIVFLLSYFKMK